MPQRHDHLRAQALRTGYTPFFTASHNAPPLSLVVQLVHNVGMFMHDVGQEPRDVGLLMHNIVSFVPDVVQLMHEVGFFMHDVVQLLRNVV